MADGVEKEVHRLGLAIAKLQPLVNEVHEHIPRIALALETLARVTEKLESNTEEHRRIHYRITAEEEAREKLGDAHEELGRKFSKLWDEHLVCTTKSRVRESDARESLWSRIKDGAAEKAGEYLVVGFLALAGGLLFLHFSSHPMATLVLGLAKTG